MGNFFDRWTVVLFVFLFVLYMLDMQESRLKYLEAIGETRYAQHSAIVAQHKTARIQAKAMRMHDATLRLQSRARQRIRLAGVSIKELERREAEVKLARRNLKTWCQLQMGFMHGGKRGSQIQD